MEFVELAEPAVDTNVYDGAQFPFLFENLKYKYTICKK